jgi:hypothetical protein
MKNQAFLINNFEVVNDLNKLFNLPLGRHRSRFLGDFIRIT